MASNWAFCSLPTSSFGIREGQAFEQLDRTHQRMHVRFENPFCRNVRTELRCDFGGQAWTISSNDCTRPLPNLHSSSEFSHSALRIRSTSVVLTAIFSIRSRLLLTEKRNNPRWFFRHGVQQPRCRRSSSSLHEGRGSLDALRQNFSRS